MGERGMSRWRQPVVLERWQAYSLEFATAVLVVDQLMEWF